MRHRTCPTARPAVRRAGWVVAALTPFALAACFTSSADFRDDAEGYIRDEVAEALEVTFTDVTCEEPPNQDEGTTFTCTAVDADGGAWQFENTIEGKNEYRVSVERRPSADGMPTDTSVTAGG